MNYLKGTWHRNYANKVRSNVQEKSLRESKETILNNKQQDKNTLRTVQRIIQTTTRECTKKIRKVARYKNNGVQTQQ